MAKKEPSLRCIVLEETKISVMLMKMKNWRIVINQIKQCIPGLGTGLSGVQFHQKVVVVLEDPPVVELFVEYEPEPDCHTIADNPNQIQKSWLGQLMVTREAMPKVLQAQVQPANQRIPL